MFLSLNALTIHESKTSKAWTIPECNLEQLLFFNRSLKVCSPTFCSPPIQLSDLHHYVVDHSSLHHSPFHQSALNSIINNFTLHHTTVHHSTLPHSVLHHYALPSFLSPIPPWPSGSLSPNPVTVSVSRGRRESGGE